MSPPLPSGWVEAVDPKSGRKYYANPKTRETRWDPPEARREKLHHHRHHRESSVSQPSHDSGGGGSSHRRSVSDVSSTQTRSAIGHSGNLLYTAPHINEAWRNPNQLIPMTRQMLSKAAAFPDETKASELELYSISAGQIADLCHIQHKTNTCGENVAYTPLNPFRMSTKSQGNFGEAGRLDVRMFALKQKLQKFSGAAVAD